MFYREKNIKLAYSEKEYKLIMKIENNDNFLQMLLSDKENLLTENYHRKLSLEELQLLNLFFKNV